MAYKSSDTNVLNDNKTAKFSKIIVGVNHTTGSNAPPIIGNVSGYTSGGFAPPFSTYGYVNTIDKFPFATDGNTSDVGDLFQNRGYVAGHSSSANGYTSGGFAPPIPGRSVVIDKFPFSSNANASDVADLTQARNILVGQSSDVNGYASGGAVTADPLLPPAINTIDKFPFAADANATDVGDLTLAKYAASGQSSDVNGYVSGGNTGSLIISNIDKFSFASDANAADIGNITQARYSAAGQSSGQNGYTSGGAYLVSNPPITYLNTIDKFPFSTDADASDVGDLITNIHYGAGTSSTVNGYAAGSNVNGAPETTIEKFPISSDTNSSDVGDLTLGRYGAAGQQV